ncbi:MAG TPA: hypothetical protein VL068_09020, partial [Microthrixaceae bacterium]|nr:hypothetical protein [Microthrixaceae bacterium]
MNDHPDRAVGASAVEDRSVEGDSAQNRSVGATYVLVGLFVAAVLGLGTMPGVQSSFGLSSGGPKHAYFLTLPSRWTVLALGALCIAIGVYQFAIGFSRRSAATVTVATFATAAVLVWATRGSEFSLVGMLQTTVSKSTPLALGAMAGILCEKSGVVNIAIEGMMLFAAFGGAVGASATGNLWIGLLVGLASGAAIAYLHAGLSITFRVDQIISGTVLNIFALGITGFLAGGLLRSYPSLNRAGTFSQINVPVLSSVPFLGTVLFRQNIFVYLM